MQEKPKVVISRTRRPESAAKDFHFTAADIRAAGEYQSLRTAPGPGRLSNGILSPIRLRKPGAAPISTLCPRINSNCRQRMAVDDLPAVREDLLKPLVADQHGGQIVLTPGGVKIDLDEKLAQKGVIFTDLKTAEQKHPELAGKDDRQDCQCGGREICRVGWCLRAEWCCLYVPKVCSCRRTASLRAVGTRRRIWLTSRTSLSWWMKAPR